jgi:proteasome accessory factor C
VSAAPRRSERAAESRLSRLLVILPWLMERREVSLAEVAATFKMTPEEVAAELELAAMCGVPPFVDELIDVFIDGETVFVGVPRLFTKPLRLTAPEGFALVTAGRAAMQLPGADPTSALGRGLAKLAAVLGEDADEAALVVDLAATPMVDEFVDATKRVERVRMRYWTASRDETTEREFTPRRVFHERGSWYVAGDDHRSGEHRTFRIDRVESLERTGVLDDPVDDSDVADSSVAWSADGSLPRVTVRLRPAARWVVEEYPVDAVTELDDGGVEARFAVVSERWLERLLLRAGTDAEVVEPAAWRDLGRRAARRLLQRYA